MNIELRHVKWWLGAYGNNGGTSGKYGRDLRSILVYFTVFWDFVNEAGLDLHMKIYSRTGSLTIQID